MKIVTTSYDLREVFSKIFNREHYLNTDIPYYFSLQYFIKDFLDTESTDGLLVEQIKFADYDENTNKFTYKDYIADMLDEFYNRYAYYEALICNQYDTILWEARMFFFRFINALNITYPIYSKLIKIYADEENHLMNSLNRDYTDDADSSGSSTNRFNDTPQNGGDYKNDTHTTNISQVSSSTESGLEHKEEYNNEYVIDRLNKINDNLRNLYMEWENKIAKMLWLRGER